MKILADANVESLIVKRLREDGHDVTFMSEIAPRVEDQDVLRRAVREKRVLLSNDLDFGELTFLQHQASAGIILIRLKRYRAWAKAERVLAVVRSGISFERYLTVIQPNAVRRRPFPS